MKQLGGLLVKISLVLGLIAVTSCMPAPMTPTTSFPTPPVQPAPVPEKEPTATPTTPVWQSYHMVETLRIGNIDNLWMPVPREWDGIGMANVKVIDISPPPDDVYEDDIGNKIAFWDTKHRDWAEYTITFELDVSPIQYDIDPLKIGQYDTKSLDYRKYTKPSQWIQSDNEAIIKLAQEIADNETNLLAKVRRLHHWVSVNVRAEGEEAPDAVTTLEKRSGYCGGHSFLFVALCRALGIPARPVAGLHTVYQGQFVSGSAYKGTMYLHIWSEFYVPGFGWVQCDTSGGEQNYMGINEPRIVLSRGEDINLVHDFPGGTVIFFHSPQTNSNVNAGIPYTQTWGEDLSLVVRKNTQ